MRPCRILRLCALLALILWSGSVFPQSIREKIRKPVPLSRTEIILLHSAKPSSKHEKTPRPSDRPWGLGEELLAMLGERADCYRSLALRFCCTETSRRARYDAAGRLEKESVARNLYLLEKGGEDGPFREYRPDGNGRVGSGWPPSYAWTLLFSPSNRHTFGYRDGETRLDGFDLVRDIEFCGILPQGDGEDIREWEGVARVDASSGALLSVDATPRNQNRLLTARYLEHVQRLKVSLLLFVGPFPQVIGSTRVGARPLGRHCRVVYEKYESGLSLPIESRYETLLAVSRDDTVPIEVETRRYENYAFFRTNTSEEIDRTAPDK